MTNEECIVVLERFIRLGVECEYVEFKEKNDNPELIGKYISGLSNGANLHNQKYAYLIFGIKDQTLEIVGTDFNPKTAKYKNNQDLELGLSLYLSPSIDFHFYSFIYKNKNLVLIQIPAAFGQPTLFHHISYIPFWA